MYERIKRLLARVRGERAHITHVMEEDGAQWWTVRFRDVNGEWDTEYAYSQEHAYAMAREVLEFVDSWKSAPTGTPRGE